MKQWEDVMQELLLKQGYAGPIATPCTLEIDEMVKLQWLQEGRELMALMREVVKEWPIIAVRDMTMGSPDFLGVVHVDLGGSEFVMVVPWKRQYDEGGQICVYHKEDPHILEIDAVLVQLIELLEVKCISHC